MTVRTTQDPARKKQLGQYFTGERVGRLLAALAGAESAKTIIDPMVGSADLLVSCLQVGAEPDRLVGLDLDPLAIARAQGAMSGVADAELMLANAFEADLPTSQFDLVITNPPYIRYQSRGEVDGVFVPTSEGVRTGLIRAIESRAGLSDRARALMIDAAQSYPGTSDIAVPAWILCAALVREGGVVAVVAPQAWLSRKYAHAVRELLDVAFDVEVIVEDGDASWFDNVQVRTHLVVARRRGITARQTGRAVIMARATSALDTDGSLRGGLRSERDLAAALRQVTASVPEEVTQGLTAYVEHDLSVSATGRGGHVPVRVAAAVGAEARTTASRTLEFYGWRAGQGLRTGANDFFYVALNDGHVRPAARWGTGSLAIPSECLLPAVRRQSELGEDLEIVEASLSTRVLNLRGWATAHDKKLMGNAGDTKVLPASVGRWIEQVSSSPLSPKDPAKRFPTLAAVAPNSRIDREGRPVGFWYQLPELAPRHRPKLFVGRVCGGQPTTYANEAAAVVDANFSTLWPTASEALPIEAMLALLHSSWTWANLEASCTVLGGGALKVEATDLRRLALPDLTGEAIERLSVLGCALAKCRTDGLVAAIDHIVAGALIPSRSNTANLDGLRAFASQALAHRSQR